MRRLLLVLTLLVTGSAPAHGAALVRGEYTKVAGRTPGRILRPGAIATAPDGRIAVADGGVEVLAADGTLRFEGPARSTTYGVAFAPDGTVYAGEDGVIHHFATDGHELAAITDGLTAHATFLRPEVVTVGGDGDVHAYVDDQLMTWTADGVRVRATPQPTRVSLAADASGRVFRGGAGGIDLLADDDTVAQHITDAYGQVSVDPADHLVARTDTDFVSYDKDFHVTGTVPVAPPPASAPEGIHSFAVTAGGDYLTTSVQVAAITRQGPDGTLLAPFGADPGAGLFTPDDVAGRADGSFVVADSGDRRVVQFGSDGAFAGAIWDGAPQSRYGVAAYPDGDVLVSAAIGGGADEIARYGPDGTRRWSIATEFGDVSRAPAAVGPDGTAWVRGADRVVHVGGDGTLLGSVPYYDRGLGLAVDGAGRLYLTSPGWIALFGPDGVERSRLPTAFSPYGIAVSRGGRVAVTDVSGWHVFGPDGTLLFSEPSSDQLQRPVDVTFAGSDDVVYLLDDARGQVLRTELRAGPAAPAPSATSAPTATAAPVISRPVLTIITRKARVRHRRVRVKLRCTGARCAGRIRIGGGSAKLVLAAGHARTARVRVSRRTARAVRRRGRLRVRAAATVAGGRGQTRKLVLRG